MDSKNQKSYYDTWDGQFDLLTFDALTRALNDCNASRLILSRSLGLPDGPCTVERIVSAMNGDAMTTSFLSGMIFSEARKQYIQGKIKDALNNDNL